MLPIVKRKNWLSLVICLVGLLILLGYRAVLPAHAQERVSSVKIRVDDQEVEIQDADGDVVGRGKFRADVAGDLHGRTSGMAELKTDDFTLRYDFNRLDEILYEDGEPSGVVLSGRGVLIRDGQTETFDGKATIGATTTIPDCLIWDIPEPASEFLTLDALGQMEF